MQSFVQFIGSKTVSLLKEMNIDELLVSKGFAYLEILIKRNNELFGGDVSEQRKALFLNEDVKKEQNILLSKIRNMCREHDSVDVSSYQAADALFEKILTDDTLYQHVKEMTLWRYFRNQYYDLITPYESNLEEAKLCEYQNVCTCFGRDENEFLGSLDQLEKRRSVYNTVVNDILLPHGFVKRTQVKGFVGMHKLLGDDVAIVFSPDTVNLLEYFQTIGSLNIDNYVGATKRSNKSRYYNFHYPMAFLAYDVYRRYQDIHSMEAAIRARGIMYEAIQPTLEIDIKKYLEKHDVLVNA